MKEWELRPHAARFLQSRGLYPICEVAICHLVDYVGCQFAERTGRTRPALIRVESVELKLDDVSGVIQQATRNAGCVNMSWVMMPAERIKQMRHATMQKFREVGIGLLSESDVVIEAIETGNDWSRRTDNLWRRSLKEDSRHTTGRRLRSKE